MKHIEKKDKVTISYIGTLDDGTIFKNVSSETPMKIVVGNLDVPPTLENALLGKTVGEKVQVIVDPEEGYGVRHKDLLQELKQADLGESINPTIGAVLSLKVYKDGQDHQIPATIVEINDDTITIDYNHPLAGHTLTYDVEVIEIVK